MAQNFDPYRKWLGIPPEEQPPNHYRLLGIALYEDDPDVIAHAADRQMSHVRKFQSGQHGEYSQLVLNELAKARVCLLDRAQKIAYDQELSRTLGGAARPSGAPVAARRGPQSAPVPSRPVAAPVQPVPPPATVATMEPPAPMAAPVATPVEPMAAVSPVGVGARPARSAAARARRKASPVPLVLAICGLAMVAALAAIVAVVASGNSEDEGETTTVVQTDAPPLPSISSPANGDDTAEERPVRDHPTRPANTDDDPNQPDKLIIPDNPENRVEEDAPSLPTITRNPADDPMEDPPSDDDVDIGEEPDDSSEDEPADEAPDEEEPDESPGPEIANDPQRAEKFAAAASAAEEAFSRRDLKEAARQIAAARRLVQGDAEAAQVAALAELMTHLGAFWRLASTGARKSKPGDELEFAGERATFDAFDDGDVALIVAGSRLSLPLEDLELPYLAALATRGAPKPDSKSRLAIAAFLALDGAAIEPERVEQAKTALAEAVSLGGRSPALEQRLGEPPAP